MRDKKSWWWDEKVQEKVKNKRECFKILKAHNNAKNWLRYWHAKNEIRKVVHEIWSKVFEEFYQDLETRKENIRYISLRNIEKRRQGIWIKCIMDKIEKVSVTDKNVKERWDNYFYKFFYDWQGSSTNVERLETQEEERNLGYYGWVLIGEVKEALKRIDKAIRVKLLVWYLMSHKTNHVPGLFWNYVYVN